VSPLVTLLGYAGAIGIVLFAIRSVVHFVGAGRAAEASASDFAILTAAGACLALYALALGDLVFLIANAGASVANGIVAVAAVRARRAIHDGDAGRG